ncbi:hypothetical protein GCM10027082_47730 [Comamonas humi]
MTHSAPTTPPHPLVEEALACEHDEAGALIARFPTASELDHFSRRYNVNDGFEPLLGVLRHPECDAGTALFIYWQFHELLDDPQARADTSSEPARWNAHALLTEIEQRYPHGFRHRRIACDPAAECARALGAEYVQGIRARHAGSPLMQPLLPIGDAP